MVEIKKNKQYFYMTLLVLFILLVTKGLKFVGWGMIPIFAKLRYMAFFLIPITALIFYNKIRIRRILYSWKTVDYFIFACLFTFFLRMAIYGGGYGYGLENNLFVAFLFCTYFIYHYSEITERSIIMALVAIGVVVLCIQVYQQYHPEMAMFSVYTEEMKEAKGVGTDYIVSQRNGLYRFIPVAAQLPLFLFCYYFSKLLIQIKIKYLLFVGVFAASTYLMLTRMFMLCLGICAFFIYWSQRKKTKSKLQTVVLVSILIFLVYNYADVLFSDLFSSKNSDIDESGSTRLGSMPFILSQAISNPLLFITGHGYPAQLWEWGVKLGYWWNDLGIFGQIYPYGIIWFFVYLKLVYWILVKMRKRIPVYIRAYTFSLFCICFLTSSYAGNLVSTLVWVILLYICDLYISKSDRTENNVI